MYKKNKEDVRSSILTVRVTSREREVLHSMCEEHGYRSVAALVRDRLIEPLKRQGTEPLNGMECSR